MSHFKFQNNNSEFYAIVWQKILFKICSKLIQIFTEVNYLTKKYDEVIYRLKEFNLLLGKEVG